MFPECVYCVFLLGLDLDPDPDFNTARAEDLGKNDYDCSPGRMELKVRLTAAAGRLCEVGSHDPRRTLVLPTLDAISRSHLSVIVRCCSAIHPQIPTPRTRRSSSWTRPLDWTRRRRV